MAKQTQTKVETKVETKGEKFYRLASKRLTRALKDVNLLGNLATSQYEHTEAQVDYICKQLLEAVTDVQNKLNKVKTDSGMKVELPR